MSTCSQPNVANPEQVRATLAYLQARSVVLRAGYAWEVDWQECVADRPFSETDFLREAAWVILSSGMRASVVRSRFSHITDAFLEWRSASEILAMADECRSRALQVFRHPSKIDAILSACHHADRVGVATVRAELVRSGPQSLQVIPFIGPITSQHLAKNLGFPTAKADRHLVRIASALGYSDVNQLCADVSSLTEHPSAVVDLVFWRFATLQPSYLRKLQAGE
jgi:hypothetical protein